MLGATLRLAHPVLPHVTERIWGELGETTRAGAQRVARGRRRASATRRASEPCEQAFDFVVSLRQLRAGAQLPPRAPLAVRGVAAGAGGRPRRDARRRHARRRETAWRAVDVIAVGDVPVTVLAPGGAENLRPRLEQELAKAEGEIERARKKLADARFVERAPAQLVEAEREKAERFEREAAELRARLDAVGA